MTKLRHRWRKQQPIAKSHKRFQKEQARPEPLGFIPEPRAIRTAIEPDQGRGDHVDLDLGEIETAMPSTVRANKQAMPNAVTTLRPPVLRKKLQKQSIQQHT